MIKRVINEPAVIAENVLLPLVKQHSIPGPWGLSSSLLSEGHSIVYLLSTLPRNAEDEGRSRIVESISKYGDTANYLSVFPTLIGNEYRVIGSSLLKDKDCVLRGETIFEVDQNLCDIATAFEDIAFDAGLLATSSSRSMTIFAPGGEMYYCLAGSDEFLRSITGCSVGEARKVWKESVEVLIGEDEYYSYLGKIQW